MLTLPYTFPMSGTVSRRRHNSCGHLSDALKPQAGWARGGSDARTLPTAAHTHLHARTHMASFSVACCHSQLSILITILKYSLKLTRKWWTWVRHCGNVQAYGVTGR